jgi:hypothetical protein
LIEQNKNNQGAAIMRDGFLPEVTRFVVKVPVEMADHRADLTRCLNSTFPARTFSCEIARDKSDSLTLIPVMEDAEGRAHLCRAPERSMVCRIYEIIEDFLTKAEVNPA